MPIAKGVGLRNTVFYCEADSSGWCYIASRASWLQPVVSLAVYMSCKWNPIRLSFFLILLEIFMNKLNSVVCAAMLAMASTAAMSADQTLPSKVEIESITAGATITAVDQAKRTFTVTGKGGKSHDFTAGPEMQNFGQMKVGDRVEASYVEELSISVNKSGMKPKLEEKTSVARAEKGGRPGMILTDSMEVVGIVTAIDHKTRSITVKGPKGKDFTTNVKPDVKNFENVAKGDNVVVNYKQTLTIADLPPAK